MPIRPNDHIDTDLARKILENLYSNKTLVFTSSGEFEELDFLIPRNEAIILSIYTSATFIRNDGLLFSL